MKTKLVAISLSAVLALFTASIHASASVDQSPEIPSVNVDAVPFFEDSTPIPEPAAALLGAIGVMGLLRRRR